MYNMLTPILNLYTIHIYYFILFMIYKYYKIFYINLLSFYRVIKKIDCSKKKTESPNVIIIKNKIYNNVFKFIFNMKLES